MSDPQPSPIVNIVQVPFHGDTLDCLRMEDAIWLSVSRVCSNLGLADQAQTRKLREKPRAVVAMIATTDARGLVRDTWCLPN